MSYRDLAYLVLDTETTGLTPRTDRIVEVGALLYRADGTKQVGDSWLVNPGMHIPEEATAIHGITDEKVATAPSLLRVWHDHLKGLVKVADVIVGYNLYGFDEPMLAAELGEHWSLATAGVPKMDPLVLVRTDEVGRWWKGKGRHKLAEAARRLGVPQRDPHRALGDCQMAGDILLHLLERPDLSELLPPDPEGVESYLRQRKAEQDEDFQNWLARQRRAERNG